MTTALLAQMPIFRKSYLLAANFAGFPSLKSKIMTAPALFRYPPAEEKKEKPATSPSKQIPALTAIIIRELLPESPLEAQVECSIYLTKEELNQIPELRQKHISYASQPYMSERPVIISDYQNQIARKPNPQPILYGRHTPLEPYLMPYALDRKKNTGYNSKHSQSSDKHKPLELLIRPQLHHAVIPEKPLLFQTAYGKIQHYLPSFSIVGASYNYDAKPFRGISTTSATKHFPLKYSSNIIFLPPAPLTLSHHQDILFPLPNFPANSPVITTAAYPQKNNHLFLPEHLSIIQEIPLVQSSGLSETETPEFAIKSRYSFSSETSNILLYAPAPVSELPITPISRLSIPLPASLENSVQDNELSFIYSNAGNTKIDKHRLLRISNPKHSIFPETNGSPYKPENFSNNMLRYERRPEPKYAGQRHFRSLKKLESPYVLSGHHTPYAIIPSTYFKAATRPQHHTSDLTVLSSSGKIFLPFIKYVKPEVTPLHLWRQYASNTADVAAILPVYDAQPVMTEITETDYQKPAIETSFTSIPFDYPDTIKYYERIKAGTAEDGILQAPHNLTTDYPAKTATPPSVQLQQNLGINRSSALETESEFPHNPEPTPKISVTQENQTAVSKVLSSAFPLKQYSPNHSSLEHILSGPPKINNIIATKSPPEKKTQNVKYQATPHPAPYETAAASTHFPDTRVEAETPEFRFFTFYQSENETLIGLLSGLTYSPTYSVHSNKTEASKPERKVSLPHAEQSLSQASLPVRISNTASFSISPETLMFSELPYRNENTDSMQDSAAEMILSRHQVMFSDAYKTSPVTFSANRKHHAGRILMRSAEYHRQIPPFIRLYLSSSIALYCKTTTLTGFYDFQKHDGELRRKNVHSNEIQAGGYQFNLQEHPLLERYLVRGTIPASRRTKFQFLSVPPFTPNDTFFIGNSPAEGNFLPEKEKRARSLNYFTGEAGQRQIPSHFSLQKSNRSSPMEKIRGEYALPLPAALAPLPLRPSQSNFSTEPTSPYLTTSTSTKLSARRKGNPEIQTLPSSEKIAKATPLLLHYSPPSYYYTIDSFLSKNTSLEKDIFLRKEVNPLHLPYTPMQNHSIQKKNQEILQNKYVTRSKHDVPRISSQISKLENLQGNPVFERPISYSENKSFQYSNPDQTLKTIFSQSPERVSIYGSAKLRTYNSYRTESSYLPKKNTPVKEAPRNNQQDDKEEIPSEYSETEMDTGLEQKINDDSTSEEIPGKAGLFSALGALLLGGVMSAASALGRARNAYSNEREYSGLTEEHETEHSYTTYNEHSPKTAGQTAESHEISEEENIETVLEEALAGGETQQEKTELNGFYSVLGHQKVEARHISEDKVRITAYDSETGQQTDYELKGNSWYAVINSILEEVGLTPQYKIMTYTDIETGEKKKGLYLSAIAEVDSDALDTLGRDNERLSGIIGLLNGSEPQSGKMSLEEVLLTEGDIVEIAYIIHGLYTADYGADSNHDKEEEFSLHYVSKGDSAIPGFAALIEDYLLDNADIMQEGEEYEIETVHAEANDESLLRIHPNSWYAVTDRVLKKAGLTPRYKMVEYTDIDTGLTEKGLYLEGIEELDSTAREMLGTEKADAIGILGFVNGEEPGGGTVPLTEVIMKPGDRISLAYIVQGLYDGSFGSGISGHEAEDYNLLEDYSLLDYDFSVNEKATTSF